MIDKEDMVELVMNGKPVELREFCKLLANMLNDEQIQKLQPLFNKKVSFDWKKALEINNEADDYRRGNLETPDDEEEEPALSDFNEDDEDDGEELTEEQKLAQEESMKKIYEQYDPNLQQ